MLFEETINKCKDEVAAAVDQLYDLAYQNQINENDLLLVLENGLKKEYDEATLKRLKITPYHIGPDFIGLRYDTFYQFINYYRNGIKSKKEFLKEFNDEKTKESFLDFYRDFSAFVIYEILGDRFDIEKVIKSRKISTGQTILLGVFTKSI